MRSGSRSRKQGFRFEQGRHLAVCRVEHREGMRGVIVSSMFLWGQSESMFGITMRLTYRAMPIPSSSISGIERFCLKSTAALFVISDANRSPSVSTLFV